MSRQYCDPLRLASDPRPIPWGGGAALKNVSQSEADRALELLLEYGVNHIDTAPRYGDAELRIGPWIRAHRQDFFWATTEPNRNTWYQPFEDPADVEQVVHWMLARPRIFLNTVGDLDLLPLVLDAASRFEASPGDGAMRAVVEARRATALFGIAT